MSYISTTSATNTNSVNALQNVLASLNSVNTNTTTNPYPIVHSINGSGYSTNQYRIAPAFKMELFKSENGGFVMHLITTDNKTNHETTKMFILSNVENMGNDIQNILVMEILRT